MFFKQNIVRKSNIILSFSDDIRFKTNKLYKIIYLLHNYTFNIKIYYTQYVLENL